MGTTGLETAFAAALHRARGARACCRWRWWSRSSRRAPRSSGCRCRHRRRSAGELLPASTSRRSGRSEKPDTRAARRTAASRAGPCAGACSPRSPPARSPTASARSPSWGLREPPRARSRRARRRRRPGGLPVLEAFESMAAACGRLVEGARILGLPVVATEQYPKGLGPVRARGRARRRRAAVREDGVLGRARGGLRPRRARPGDRLRDRGARLRLPDRPRPARPRRRGPRRRATRWPRAIPVTWRSAWRKMERGGCRDVERGDGAVRAVRRRGHGRVQGGPEGDQVSGDAAARRRRLPAARGRHAASTATPSARPATSPARSSSRPACRATRSR